MDKQIQAWYPNDPFKILVSCILSLRIFYAYKTPTDFAYTELKKLKQIIKPSGFLKKAQTLQKIS